MVRTKEEIKDYHRNYYLRNKFRWAKINLHSKTYYLENKGKMKKRNLKYRIENRDLIIKKARLKRLEKKDGVLSCISSKININKVVVWLNNNGR